MGDPDIVLDLCEHNFSTSNKYKPFWEQCKAYLQEVTAVYECRHKQMSYVTEFWKVTLMGAPETIRIF